MKKNSSHIILTEENFKKEVLQSRVPVLVEVSAEWSGGCQIMASIIEKVADKYEGIIKIGKLEFNCHGYILKEYRVYELPVLLFYVNGQVVHLIVGAVSRETLEASIDEVLYKKKEV